jgi:hypothetical protein
MTASTPIDASPPANRLTIAHLLLWTAATALALIAIMPERTSWSDVSEELRAQMEARQRYWSIAAVIAAPFLGAGLAMVGLGGWRCMRSEELPTLPGHWLLMVVGSGTLAALIGRLAIASGSLLGLEPLLWILVMLMPVVALALAIAHVTSPLRWKRVFAIAGWSTGLLFFSMFCCFPVWITPLSHLILPGLVLATPISVIVAAVRDVQLDVKQDIFHWCGVVAVPALGVVFLVALLVG